MEIAYENLLDIALGGPEIGPLNLSVLHGLLREMFQKLDIAKQSFIVEKEDPDFSDSFNFIKSKVEANNERPRTPRGGYNRLKSKVSVIVTDYFRSPLGNSPCTETPSIISADVEDRLRYIESQLRVVKAFPSADELRNWAQEKTNPDTVVTDLWHFVSLNHRMDATEEGIKKLSELVDRLIPELKTVTEEQNKMKGQIDDLYSQLRGLSDRATRIDNRIDAGADKAQEKLNELLDSQNALDDKFFGYAKLSDVAELVPMDVFEETQAKALDVVEQINEDMNNRVHSSTLQDLVNQDEFNQLADWVKILRAQMETVPSRDDLLHMDLYVKWPQLEDALSQSPHKRRCSRLSKSCSPTARQSTQDAISLPNQRIHAKKFPTESCLQRLSDLGLLSEKLASLMDALDATRDEVNEKADKMDLQNLVTKEDLQHLLTLAKDLRQDINGIQNWRDNVDEERVPALRDALNAMEEQLVELLNKLSNLYDGEQTRKDQLQDLCAFVQQLHENKLDKDDHLLVDFARKTSLQLIPEKPATPPKLPPICATAIQLPPSTSPPQSSPRPTSLSTDNNFPPTGRNFERTPHQGQTHTSKYSLSTETTDGPVEHLYTREVDDDGHGDEGDLRDGDGNPIVDYDHLNQMLDRLLERFNNHEEVYKSNLNAILNELEEKLDREELQPLKEYLETRYSELSDLQRQQDNSAKTPNKTKSTSSPVYVSPTGTPYKEKKFASSYLDNVSCTHPYYGDGLFVPQQREAALMRKQMKFNCLSCDRPLTMQTNGHLQTIRGKPLNAYELDQLRLLQNVLKGDKTKKMRSCGGEHTMHNPIQKVNVRVNASLNLPPVMKHESDGVFDGEIDIEGVDGRLYRGLVSRKDFQRNHLRSRSENSQLRTVSPQPYTNSKIHSMSSGLGGTYPGSMDVQVDRY